MSLLSPDTKPVPLRLNSGIASTSQASPCRQENPLGMLLGRMWLSKPWDLFPLC